MHYAIIAAGEGSRLVQEGIHTPKPLVLLRGECMLDRLLRIFLANHAESITLIINREMESVRQHLEEWQLSSHLHSMGLPADFPFRVVVQSTPSSMHSLAALVPFIPEGKFCLTTVDTVFREAEFHSYIRQFEAGGDRDCDGLFAVTSFVDDEKPLYVKTDASLRIEAFADVKPATDCFISGGIYCLHTATAFPVLDRCLASGQARMRNFQRALIASGLKLKAYPFAKIIDVDHASDICVAASFIGE